MSPPSTSVSLETRGEIARISLNPPRNKPPTLDQSSLQELDTILEEIMRKAPEIRVVILESRSERFFCAGANLDVLKTLTAKNFGEWLELGHRVFALLENLPVQVVAKVGGYALGGGLELAMAADVIVAGESARLGLTEARLGFVPGWGGIFRLAERVGRSRAKRMCSTPARWSMPLWRRLSASSIGWWRTIHWTKLSGNSRTRSRPITLPPWLPLNGFSMKNVAARQRVDAAEIAASMDCIRDPDTKDRIKHFLNRPKRRT